jgi:hypothetical protein
LNHSTLSTFLLHDGLTESVGVGDVEAVGAVVGLGVAVGCGVGLATRSFTFSSPEMYSAANAPGIADKAITATSAIAAMRLTLLLIFAIPPYSLVDYFTKSLFQYFVSVLLYTVRSLLSSILARLFSYFVTTFCNFVFLTI